jgi:hypothetical protein
MSSRPRLLFAPLSPRSSASAGLATSRPIRTRQPRAHRTRPAPLQPRRVRLRHRLGSSGSCRIGLGRLLGRARVGSGRRCGWPTCFSARGRRRTANIRSCLHLPPPIIQGLSWPLRLSSLQHMPPMAALLVRPFMAAIRDSSIAHAESGLGKQRCSAQACKHAVQQACGGVKLRGADIAERHEYWRMRRSREKRPETCRTQVVTATPRGCQSITAGSAKGRSNRKGRGPSVVGA